MAGSVVADEGHGFGPSIPRSDGSSISYTLVLGAVEWLDLGLADRGDHVGHLDGGPTMSARGAELDPTAENPTSGGCAGYKTQHVEKEACRRAECQHEKLR